MAPAHVEAQGDDPAHHVVDHVAMGVGWIGALIDGPLIDLSAIDRNLGCPEGGPGGGEVGLYVSPGVAEVVVPALAFGEAEHLWVGIAVDRFDGRGGVGLQGLQARRKDRALLAETGRDPDQQ
ncbi:MAG: hypothetical protein IPG45_02295 [Deltaproteobacteria bacterium]|nr:hypothetical protein [Deltaproteobacteria bacterium]